MKGYACKYNVIVERYTKHETKLSRLQLKLHIQKRMKVDYLKLIGINPPFYTYKGYYSSSMTKGQEGLILTRYLRTAFVS